MLSNIAFNVISVTFQIQRGSMENEKKLLYFNEMNKFRTEKILKCKFIQNCQTETKDRNTIMSKRPDASKKLYEKQFKRRINDRNFEDRVSADCGLMVGMDPVL